MSDQTEVTSEVPIQTDFPWPDPTGVPAGFTLRDFFAAHNVSASTISDFPLCLATSKDVMVRNLARQVYRLADFMLEVRLERPE